MTRLMLMTFFSEKRWAEDVHPHESPKVMTVPLIVLAALSVLGGLLLLNDWIVDWLAPVVGEEAHEEPPLPALVITVIVAGGRRRRRRASPGSLIGRREVPRDGARPRSRSSPAPARADLYGDAFNDAVVVRPGKRVVTGPGRPSTAASSTARSMGTAAAIGGLVRPVPAAGRTASSAPTPCPCSAARSSSSLALLVVNLA